MKTKKQKKGISLMVLILTIIIMVILAGTVIISLNNAGIINRSQDTVNDYNLKQIEEMANVGWGEAYLAGNTTQEKIEEYVIDYLERNGVATEKYIITVTNKGVTIVRDDWVVAYASTTQDNTNWTRYTQGQKIAGETVIKLYSSSTQNMYDAVIYGTGIIEAEMYPLEDGTMDNYFLSEDSNNIKTLEIKEGITGIAGICYGWYNLQTVILPTGMTYIGAQTFERSAIENITLPDGLTTIGDSAFCDAVNLKSINIPDSVISIDYGAFSNSGLENITLPANLTEISDYVFANTNIKEIELPKDITRIGSGAFENTQIEEITIPSKVTSIGFCAFASNDNLKKIKILSETLIDVEDGAFSTEGEVDVYVLNEEVKSIVQNNGDFCNVHVVTAEEMKNI